MGGRKATVTSVVGRTRRTRKGCWLWQGFIDEKGYGWVWFHGKMHRAHRIIYQLLAGEIQTGLTLDHLCRNRACVNPNHLDPVTNKTNVLRGVGAPARNARKKRCSKGHQLTAENIYQYGPRRVCKKCHKERQKRHRSKN